MNTRILLLLMCSFVFFNSISSDPTQCSIQTATEEYEKTLFVVFFEHSEEDVYRNNILYVLKLLLCFITESSNFRGIYVDYSVYGTIDQSFIRTRYLKMSQLQQELDNIEKDKYGWGCTNFKHALKVMFVEKPIDQTRYQHIELIVVNFMKPPVKCNFNDDYQDRLQKSGPLLDKVHPIIIDASVDFDDRFCLNIEGGCYVVDSEKPASLEVMKYLGKIAASFHRLKTQTTLSTTFDTTTQTSSDTTPDSSTTSESDSTTTVLTTQEITTTTATTLPTTTETTTESTTVTETTTTEAPYPSTSHDKPDQKSDDSDDLGLQFWLSILLIFLLVIVIAATIFIVFKVWQLKKLLAKISKSQPVRKPLIPHEQSKKSKSKEKTKTTSQISMSNRESLSKSLMNKMSPT